MLLFVHLGCFLNWLIKEAAVGSEFLAAPCSSAGPDGKAANSHKDQFHLFCYFELQMLDMMGVRGPHLQRAAVALLPSLHEAVAAERRCHHAHEAGFVHQAAGLASRQVLLVAVAAAAAEGARNVPAVETNGSSRVYHCLTPPSAKDQTFMTAARVRTPPPQLGVRFLVTLHQSGVREESRHALHLVTQGRESNIYSVNLIGSFWRLKYTSEVRNLDLDLNRRPAQLILPEPVPT